jgi:dTMP kinase
MKNKKSKLRPKSVTKVKPKFIAIEGGEGSGKTSLILLLKDVFDNPHFPFITTREPGGSPYAEVIRNTALKDPLAGGALPETMLCLMFASRYDHVKNTVVPALESGISVITDRFDASSYAYNVSAQSGGSLAEVFWHMHRRLIRVPDLYIYIDVTSEEGLRRAHSRNQSLLDGNHFDDREVDFHNLVRAGYRQFFKEKSIRSIIIDGNKPFDQVKEEFISLIKKELQKK